MTSVMIAVDAENISYKMLPGIEAMASKMGDVISRKVFGDFEMLRMRPWLSVSNCNNYLMVNSPHIKSKNIADMTMIIEIMEAVFERKPDVVVIGTGDADFVPLVNKLRSKGIVVIGAGTPESSHHFKQACDFFKMPDLDEPSLGAKAEASIELPKSISKMLSRIAAQVLRDYRRHEWVPISRLGDELSKQKINTDFRHLGISSLSEALVMHLGFEVQKEGKLVSFRRKGLTNERQCGSREMQY